MPSCPRWLTYEKAPAGPRAWPGARATFCLGIVQSWTWKVAKEALLVQAAHGVHTNAHEADYRVQSVLPEAHFGAGPVVPGYRHFFYGVAPYLRYVEDLGIKAPVIDHRPGKEVLGNRVCEAFEA